MKKRVLINIFLLFVLVMQLLPIKQAVRYFFIENAATEEIVDLDVNKEISKSFKALEEDYDNATHFECFFSPLYNFNNTLFAHKKETLPPLHTEDIPTPPPNC